MKSLLNNIIHKIILPRGRNYTKDETIEKGWEKLLIGPKDNQICILKSTSDHKTKKGVVLLSHPYLSDAKQFFLKRGHAKMYVDNGFDVIIMDYNGFGESPFSGFEYKNDVATVTAFIKKNYSSMPIFGHGISFGASHLITICCSDHHFTKIIIENCLDSNLSYYKKRNKNLYYFMKLVMKVMPNTNKDHNYEEAAKKIDSLDSILYIYNNEDDLTTIEMGQKIKNNTQISATLAIFQGKHLDAYQNEPKRYIETVTSFLSY